MIGANDSASTDPCAHVVGGVGNLRDCDHIGLTQPEQSWQQSYELLGSDGGHDSGEREFCAQNPGGPLHHGFTQCGRTGRERVAGGVCRLRKRMLNDIGHGINGRANREIDYPLGMLARQIPKRGEPIPWKIRKPVSQKAHCDSLQR